MGGEPPPKGALDLLAGEGASRSAFSHSSRVKPLDRPGWSSVASIRGPRWKLICWLESDRVELYDLRSDPREPRSVADGRSDVAERYQAELAERLEKEGPEANRVQVPLDEALLEKLRELGYVE